jgi:P27 family predicted phage terminase small subunit
MTTPKHLSVAAKRLWKAITTGYEIDEPAAMVLQATLEAYDRREQARAAIEREGAVQTDRFGFRKPHPSVAIERDAAITMMRGFRLLGFDQEPRGDFARAPRVRT